MKRNDIILLVLFGVLIVGGIYFYNKREGMVFSDEEEERNEYAIEGCTRQIQGQVRNAVYKASRNQCLNSCEDGDACYPQCDSYAKRSSQTLSYDVAREVCKSMLG